MSYYTQAGKIPPKRHTVYRKPDGSLYHEELFGTEGFNGVSSLLYHLYPPTRVVQYGKPVSVKPEIAIEENMRALSFRTFNIESCNDYLESRKTLFVNNDLECGVAAPAKSMTDYFFKNAQSDEMLFIHKGSGTLKTPYGSIDFGYGDYLIIPRGVIYQLQFDSSDNHILYLESSSPIETPSRYRNAYGQYMEHSPFCERDIRLPKDLETLDEQGAFLVRIKKRGFLWDYTYETHPFDLIGWDGTCYPYAFSIFNFEPITGRIHMPPPIHQTFGSKGFVVCSFVPRLYDYHPEALPAPWASVN